MAFASEKDLFNAALSTVYFKSLLNTGNAECLIEPKGLFGIPDLVIANVKNTSIEAVEIQGLAFEMKLRNWQRALFQAYRYRFFAQKSYVVMDHKRVQPALMQIERFIKSNIGLLSLSPDGEIYIHFEPTEEPPYCDRLRICLEQIVLQENKLRSDRVKSAFTEAVCFPLSLVHAG
ncbi:MAG: hypothetical protein ACRYFS_15440 [Janthinobacterium lividum]